MDNSKAAAHAASETPRTTKELLDLSVKVTKLPTADKFALAAELCHAGKYDVAEMIGMRACQELQLAKLFGKAK